MPIPLSKVHMSSFDNAVTMTRTSSNVCTTTFVMTLSVVLVKLYVSSKTISDSSELSRKRKRDCSRSFSGLSCDKM